MANQPIASARRSRESPLEGMSTFGAFPHPIEGKQDPDRNQMVLKAVTAAGDEQVNGGNAKKEIQVEEEPAGIFGAPGQDQPGQKKTLATRCRRE